MRRMLFRALCAAFAAASVPNLVQAQSLTIGQTLEISAVDPQFRPQAANYMLAAHVFDTLVRQDRKQLLVPGLAESWRALDDLTWEFKLRRGVKFHDGSDFTAEDVAASIRRVQNPSGTQSAFVIYARSIRNVAIVDPYTIRFTTGEPTPLLPRDLSVISIVSRNAERATTAEFNSGAASIGTGPYRFVEWRPGERLVLRRFDGYAGPRPHWDSVTVRPISNDSSRVAALLSGGVDIIDDVPTADRATLRARADVTIAETTSTRFVYFVMDSFSDVSPFVTDAAGRPLDRNPLKDVRVRRAISKAIDRKSIVERIMDGAAVPTGQFLPDDMYGTSPNLPPEPFDPEGARRLLAEAGYPQGFGLTIHGPNNRFANDERILQAVGAMLTRAGIAAKVEAMPNNVFVARSDRFEFSAFLRSWNSETGEPSGPLRALLGTPDAKTGFGASNRGRYSNPQMDAALTRALRTLDDGAREALLREATEIAMRDAGLIPLHLQFAVWGLRRGLSYAPRADGYTLAMEVQPR